MHQSIYPSGDEDSLGSNIQTQQMQKENTVGNEQETRQKSFVLCRSLNTDYEIKHYITRQKEKERQGKEKEWQTDCRRGTVLASSKEDQLSFVLLQAREVREE